MPQRAEVARLTGLASRFGAFVAEQHPFALAEALDDFAAANRGGMPRYEAGIEAHCAAVGRGVKKGLAARTIPAGLPETSPRTTAAARLVQAHAALIDECHGFLRRAAIAAPLTPDERVEILRGMTLTRATDNRLK